MRPLPEISPIFDLLVPSKLNGGLLILLLHEKIKNEEIDEEFTRQNIQDALDEIAQQELISRPQTERILKNLLYYFIRRPVDKAGKYYLSEYAKSFIRLIEHRLDNPLKELPLKKNFENHFSLQASDVNDINDFDGWHKQNFNGAARMVLSEYMESLQDELDNLIQQLNTILHSDELTALEMAKKFATIFTELGESIEEIREVLNSKEKVSDELRKIVDKFYMRVDKADHSQNQEENSTLDKIISDWKKAEKIHEDVNLFFLNVDKHLRRISTQIIFSSKKLNELQEIFRAQSLFKLNLKKMLEFILRESVPNRDTLKLPDQLPRKIIPYERIRFVSVPFYDFRVYEENKPLEAYQDTHYEYQERQKIERVMYRQEQNSKWVDIILKDLDAKGSIVWSEYFFKILDQEQDEEIPIQVGFDLIQYAQKNANYYLEIDQTPQTHPNHHGYILWNLKITAR